MATLSSKFNKIVAPMNISSMETPYLLELDFTDKAIVKLIELAYTGTTTPPPHLVEELLQMAACAQYGITSLTKICSDFLLFTLSPGNWEQRYKLGKKSLCKHALEALQRFLSANFSSLTNEAVRVTLEEMDALFPRLDLNSSAPQLLHCLLSSCPVFSALDDTQQTRIVQMVTSSRPVSCLTSL